MLVLQHLRCLRTVKHLTNVTKCMLADSDLYGRYCWKILLDRFMDIRNTLLHDCYVSLDKELSESEAFGGNEGAGK